MTPVFRELVACGTATRAASQLTGISRATIDRQTKRAQRPQPEPREPVEPANKLTPAERAQVLDVLTSDEFVDKAPLQVYPVLLERGQYLCSPSTMYRILHEHTMVKERRRLAKHPPRKIPELVAHHPNEVYSWDITKLPGPSRGIYYDAYVMIDIFSRFLVGAQVHTREDQHLAVQMMETAFGAHGIPKVVHSDGGSSMNSKTVATLLSDLGITKSKSRPKVSNDNPYSESNFKTMKYIPEFPERFYSIGEAREFMAWFVEMYNYHHRHTGIGLHTPADVHYGLADAVDIQRQETLKAAYAAHPQRFSKTPNPKILKRTDATYINKPTTPETENQTAPKHSYKLAT